MSLWKIETTGKPGVVHLATEGTTEALCGAVVGVGTTWRVPPKKIGGDRPCKTCQRILDR